MASVLTRTLMETGQEIPDFLQAYVPEGEAGQKLKFEADSDFDEDDVAGAGDAGGGAWGASATGNDAAGADAQGADADASPWGTSAHVTPQAAAEKDEATSGW